MTHNNFTKCEAAKRTKCNESLSTAARQLPMGAHQDTAANTETHEKMSFQKTTTITHYVTAPESLSVNSVPTRLSVNHPTPKSFPKTFVSNNANMRRNFHT
jgi:hypothetical protein